MMYSKVEQKWVNYWSDLYALMDSLKTPKILDENYQVITVEQAKGIIQDTIYRGNSIELKIDFYKGGKAIIIALTGKKYKLIYQDIEIGIVHQTDPPRPFGIFELTNQQLPQYLFDFINYSFKCDELFQTNEGKWLNYIEKNEHYHLDIIESDDWYLLDEIGKMIKILVPVVGKDNINWRLN